MYREPTFDLFYDHGGCATGAAGVTPAARGASGGDRIVASDIGVRLKALKALNDRERERRLGPCLAALRAGREIRMGRRRAGR